MSCAARFRRPLVVIGVVAAALAVAVAIPRGGHGARLRPGEAGEEHEATRVIHGAICGFERWPVKTLSDPQAREVEFVPHPATVRYLGSLPARPGGQDSRGPLETRTFAVQARLVAVKREDDSDYHLVLAAGGASIIAEMPLVGCTAGAQHRYAMSAARSELERALGGPVENSWIHPRLQVRVTGVLFFDFPHGQFGHARNYAELHPVVSFRVYGRSSGRVKAACASCRLSPLPVDAPGAVCTAPSPDFAHVHPGLLEQADRQPPAPR